MIGFGNNNKGKIFLISSWILNKRWIKPLFEFLLENKDKVGVSNLLAELMTKGTKNKTPEELFRHYNEIIKRKERNIAS